MKKEVTQLDLMALANRSLPKRIRDIERKQRRTGIKTGTVAGAAPTVAAPRLAYGGVTSEAGTPESEVPLSTTSPQRMFQEDGSPATVPPRPNYLRNGSFEYYQRGDVVPYAWSGASAAVAAPAFPTMDGLYTLKLLPGGSIFQTVTEAATFPAGSWVVSFWVYGADTGSLTLSLVATEDASAEIGPTLFITDLGTSTTPPSGTAGRWSRIARQVITTQATSITVTVENDSLDDLWLDAAKLEVQTGEAGFIEPTEYSPDALSGATIVRELKADNIITGTLVVGGSDTSNPVIEVYDGADVLIATLGAPSGGYRGLNVKAQAGIKVEAGGSLVAGPVTLSNAGIAVTANNVFDDTRGYRFEKPDGTVIAKDIANFLDSGSDSLAHLRREVPGVAYVRHETQVKNSPVEANVYVLDNRVAQTGGGSFEGKSELGVSSFGTATTAQGSQRALGVRGLSRLTQTAAYNSATDTQVNTSLLRSGDYLGSHATLQLTHSYDPVGGESTAAAITASVITLNGLAPATGAGTLGGTTTNNAATASHTHAIDAHSTPGGIADRILKTGTSGLLTLAALTVSTFTLGSAVLTASVSGSIALGAATLTGSTINDATIAGHTHFVDAYSAPGTTANRILKTGTSGAVTLATLTTTSLTTTNLTLGAAALTASVSGAVAVGAGTLSGSSTSNTGVAAHTHLVDSYATPGTTADRLIKTGASGLVTLASLTVTGTFIPPAPTWTDASTLMTAAGNGWVDFGGGVFAEAAYTKDALGWVHLRGLVKSGTINTTIFTLPVGFRPAQQCIFATAAANAANVYQRLDVTAGGIVRQDSAAAGTNVYQSLEGVRFYAG